MLHSKRLALALLTIAIAACAGPTGTPSPSLSPVPSGTPSGTVDSLETARATWAASDINDYDFTITRQCFCVETWIGPFAVQVRDGVSVVTRAIDGSKVEPMILEQLPLSAEELFQFAEERQGQASFRITYDQATGLPLSIWSDPIPGAADDELGIEVRDFAAAP